RGPRDPRRPADVRGHPPAHRHAGQRDPRPLRQAGRGGGPVTAVPPYPSGHGLLAGRSALVTAAAGTGIGFATAKRLHEEGAFVVISDKHERRLAESAEQLGVPSIPCDVTDEAQVQAMLDFAVVQATAAGHDGLDILVNNAGLGGTVDLVDMTDDQWNLVLDITLNGTMRCTRAALRHMLP